MSSRTRKRRKKWSRGPRLPPELWGKEVWKPVEGWDYYEISNCGRVRKWVRKIVRQESGRYGFQWYRRLVPIYDEKEGLKVELRQDGKVKSTIVKNLVASAFLFPRGKIVTYRDGDPTNCRIDNLCLRKQKTRLTPGQVDEAIRRVKAGEEQKNIAKEYMVYPGTLYKAMKRALGGGNESVSDILRQHSSDD